MERAVGTLGPSFDQLAGRSLAHDDHVAPSQVRVHASPSRPPTATVSAPGPADAADGSDVTPPPKDPHADHTAAVLARCHSAPSHPCTNTSNVPAPPDTAPGPPIIPPPNDSHPDHTEPV